MDADEYVVLLLSDSNLPTGGFIASGGLESYFSHGFMGSSRTLMPTSLAFSEHFLQNYTANSLPYSDAAYLVASAHLEGSMLHDEAIAALAALDWRQHTILLNHVGRRASMIQGSAILALYARSFAAPAGLPPTPEQLVARDLISAMRMHIRRGGARLQAGEPLEDAMAGHIAVCFGVFAACMGVTRKRMLRLCVFLQARNIMSCSIRLNTLGPYLAHQLLAFQLRPLVERLSSDYSTDIGERLVQQVTQTRSTSPEIDREPLGPWDQVWDWDWADDESTLDMPATTWPLGEIVLARHDQLHSHLFNS